MDDRLSEPELLKRFKEAKLFKERCESALEAASFDLNSAEAALIEALESQDKLKTAEYSGLGSATLVKPRLQASCPIEKYDVLFPYLKSESREDLIVTRVNAQSLSSFCKELIEQGKPVPAFISYTFLKKLKLND